MDRRNFLQRICAILFISPLVANRITAQPPTQVKTLAWHQAMTKANYVWAVPDDMIFHGDMLNDPTFVGISGRHVPNKTTLATNNLPSHYFKYITQYKDQAVPIEMLKVT